MAISRAQLVKELEPGLNALFGLEYKRYSTIVSHVIMKVMAFVLTIYWVRRV